MEKLEQLLHEAEKYEWTLEEMDSIAECKQNILKRLTNSQS